MMRDCLRISCEVTRQDWLAVNDALMRASPAWASAAHQHRRAMRRQALWAAPLVIAGAAFMLGRGQSTHGMYLEGAALGAGFAAFLYFALPRLNDIQKEKNAQRELLQRVDFSTGTGTFVITMSELGVNIHSPYRQLQFTWQAITPSAAGDFVLFQHGGSDCTFIPPRAFASKADAAEFIEQARRWWVAGQLPNAQRLERYLADRDLACPKCTYNLRGLRSESCPECGHDIQLDALMNA
jgi:hypothetical protein